MLTTVLSLFLLFPQLVDSTTKVNESQAVQKNLTREKLADIYMARKMYREAGEEYRAALEETPRNARIYNKIGISYHHQMMFSEARKNYERASDIDDKYAQAINNLGTVHYAQGNYKRAQRTYEKALKINPRSASILSNLGTAFFARSKYKKASQAYMDALALDPNVFEQKNDTGTLLQERSVRDRGKYYYFMAEAYVKAAMYDRALLYLRRCVEEGYRSRSKILADETFQPMHEMPEFQVLFNPEGKSTDAG